MSSSRRRIMDSDSDSDADVPLATLRANIKAARGSTTTTTSTTVTVKKEVVSTTTNGSTAAKTTTTAVKRVIKQESETDSDDDIPISGLAQRKKIRMEASAAPVKREPRPTSSSNRTASSSVKKEVTSSSSSSKKRAKIQFKQQECTEELYQTLKGQLTQELLCRWWYAIDWPNTAADEERRHGVQELDGFPGAYIRVKGDDMGSILDTRNPVGKPSFLHFFALPSEELQRLLVKAYKKQMEVLIEHEGEDAPMLKDLRAALSTASKISPEKADRSVSKVLKKYAELMAQIKSVQESAANVKPEEED